MSIFTNLLSSIRRLLNRAAVVTDVTQPHLESKGENLSEIESGDHIPENRQQYREIAQQIRTKKSKMVTPWEDKTAHFNSPVKFTAVSMDATKRIDDQLHEIFGGELDPLKAEYALNRLLNDPNKRDTCLELLLKKHVDKLPIHIWAEIASKSLSNAEIIFKNAEIAEGLLTHRFLFKIASVSDNHAKLILNTYNEKLGDLKEVIASLCGVKEDLAAENPQRVRRP